MRDPVRPGGRLHVAERSIFARKNYFYPLTCPRATRSASTRSRWSQGGSSVTSRRRREKTVAWCAHLEEDAGKSLHEDFHGPSGIDLNRAGTPLEIVTEPDIRSSAEAVAYAKELHKIGHLDRHLRRQHAGRSFRCDANVSVRRSPARRWAQGARSRT